MCYKNTKYRKKTKNGLLRQLLLITNWKKIASIVIAVLYTWMCPEEVTVRKETRWLGRDVFLMMLTKRKKRIKIDNKVVVLVYFEFEP